VGNIIKVLPVEKLAKLVVEDERARKFVMDLVKEHAPKMLTILGTVLTLEKAREILEVLKERNVKFQFKKGDIDLNFEID